MIAALQRCIGTRARRWLLAVTLLLGLLAAVALGAGLPPADRTFTVLAGPVQSLMSFTLPFLTVLLASDVRRSRRAARPAPARPASTTAASSAPPPAPTRPASTTAASSAAPPAPTRPAGTSAASSAAPLGPTLLAAVLLAVAVALLGAVFCAVTLALVSADGGPDPWAHAGMIVAGGRLVQVVASLTGTGMGLLLRPALAIPATVIPPLGLYVLLAAVDVLRPAQGWLTPYAALLNLLSGEMSGLRWAQWVVVAAIWAVGLNAAGWLLVKRRSGPVGDQHPALR